MTQTRSGLEDWSEGDCLIVVARWPELRAGKSRLAAALGDQAALELQRALLQDTLRWATCWPRLLLLFTPDHARAHFAAMAPQARLLVQAEGDLGDRLGAAFEAAFAAGVKRALIVGSDSPSLPTELLSACLRALEHADVGICPALDGGFVAMALRAPQPALFAGVHWSTAAVRSEVAANAQCAGLRLLETAGWYDVDERADLERLAAEVAADPQVAPACAAALERLALRPSLEASVEDCA